MTTQTQTQQETQTQLFFDKDKAISRIVDYVIGSIAEYCYWNPDQFTHECILNYVNNFDDCLLDFHMSICNVDELVEFYEDEELISDEDIEKIVMSVKEQLKQSIELLCTGGSGAAVPKIKEFLGERSIRKLCCEYHGAGNCDDEEED